MKNKSWRSPKAKPSYREWCLRKFTPITSYSSAVGYTKRSPCLTQPHPQVSQSRRSPRQLQPLLRSINESLIADKCRENPEILLSTNDYFFRMHSRDSRNFDFSRSGTLR